MQAFGDLAEVNESIDTDQLATALDTMATEFQNTPEEVRGSLDGLSRLSRTIASRDDQLRELLDSTREVTEVMASRDAELEQLINDANLLLAELERRKEDISRAAGLHRPRSRCRSPRWCRRTAPSSKPTLDRLNSVLALLEENKANLEQGLANMAPFTRVFANVLGTGRWFDTYIQNVVPVPGLALPTTPAVQP